MCKPKSKGGLGFRDIENFNLALLGKQVWWLLHNTNSLLYKVFKAKYFPQCTIMDEAVNTKGSFAWQSILKARQVIELGVVWRVGNGEKVRIRGDSWLPDPHSSKVISPQKNFPRNTQVYALLNEDGTSWIHDRIEEEFLPHEARAINSIPLSVSRANDCLIWSGSKDDNYMTKSAYRMLTEAEQRKKPGSSNQSSEGTFWKDLWDLDIPRKIKHFL